MLIIRENPSLIVIFKIILKLKCEPGLGSCMYDLWIQMLFIMVGKQFFNNFLEIYLPLVFTIMLMSIMPFIKTSKANLFFVYLLNIRWCIMWYNRCRHKKKNLPSKQWEKDYLLLSWTDYTLFDEYLEMGNYLLQTKGSLIYVKFYIYVHWKLYNSAL